MSTSMPIHEIKDHLSSVIARLAETGEAIEITKHGRVVALLMPPRPTGVVLGLGSRPDGRSLELDELQWSPEELEQMFGGPVFPE